MADPASVRAIRIKLDHRFNACRITEETLRNAIAAAVEAELRYLEVLSEYESIKPENATFPKNITARIRYLRGKYSSTDISVVVNKVLGRSWLYRVLGF